MGLEADSAGGGLSALADWGVGRDHAGGVRQRCGSAYVEAGCDAAEREIAARFLDRYLTDRFSPGYGDLPLGLQQEICTLLDTERRLGVHATEHCLLNPQKSVTAIVGLSDKPQMARIRGCAYCSMGETCLLRKGGKRCAL